MSAIIIQYAEEKARRLSLRSKTNVGTVARLLGRTDNEKLNLWAQLQAQFHQQDQDK
jgi:hypothetical protein